MKDKDGDRQLNGKFRHEPAIQASGTMLVRWRALILKSLLVLGAWSVLGGAGCDNPAQVPPANSRAVTPSLSASESAPVYFPQQAPPLEGSMTALLTGTLIEEGGCLRVKPDYPGAGNSVTDLIVWPPGVKLSTSNATVSIHNEAGEEIARVGEIVRLGGGEIGTLEALRSIKQPLSEQPPDACPGPYWLAGDILK